MGAYKPSGFLAKFGELYGEGVIADAYKVARKTYCPPGSSYTIKEGHAD